MQNWPKESCFVEIICLSMENSIPFAKKIRLSDDRMHLVFYSIQLCLHERPVVFDTGQWNSHHICFFLLKCIQDVFFHLIHPKMKHHWIFLTGLGGSDANIYNRVFAVNGVEEASGIFCNFLRSGFWSLLSALKDCSSASFLTLGVGRMLESLVFDGINGPFQHRNVRRGISFGFRIDVNVYCVF